MQIQRINSNTNFGLYKRAFSLAPAHEKLLDALHPRLSKIGKKVHLYIESGDGVVKKGSDYEIIMKCLKISAKKKNGLYPEVYTKDVFLKSNDPKQEIMDAAFSVAKDVLRPKQKNLRGSYL